MKLIKDGIRNDLYSHRDRINVSLCKNSECIDQLGSVGEEASISGSVELEYSEQLTRILISPQQNQITHFER